MIEPKISQPQSPGSSPANANLQSPIPNTQRALRLQSQYIALTLLLLLYLTLALAYAALAPLTTGPDELAHYEYVRFIADHGRLPLNNEERQQASYKSDQPPLYHLLAALPVALIDPTGPPFLKRVSDDPRRQLIERTRHAWGLYNTEDERWPYRAEVLRWQVGRWVAVLFGAATVAVTFFIAREVFSRGGVGGQEPGAGEQSEANTMANGSKPWLLALGAAAVVAFIPRFDLTGSMLNYETTAAFFTALFLWTLLRIASQPISKPSSTLHSPSSTLHPPPSTPSLLLGLFAGLAVLTKLSAIVLPLEIIIGVWLIGRFRGWPRPVWLRLMGTALAAMLVVVGLWLGFILYQFNTIAQDGLWVGLLRPLVAADASDATTNQLLSFLTGGQAGFTGAIENLESGPPWEWARIFFSTFWMVGIENVQPLASPGLAIALALCMLAAYRLIRSLTADHRPPTADPDKNKNQHLATTDPQPLPDPRPLTPNPYSRLALSLLALHLLIPLLLPVLRYAVTFSLADTAQGRHLLFPAAPAFAIVLVWGLSNFTPRIPLVTYQLPRTTHYALSLVPFLPVPLLFIWSLAHLWAMTWAYNPPLPVSTLPAAKVQAVQPLNQVLNKFVTLVGYDSQIDGAGRVLRVDFIWQATAISPVDYLTEVSLIDATGETQAQWLGYSAGGRYPTRAWDVGDIVRDTVWLPIEGLAPGDYQLGLKLIPTSRHYPSEAEAASLTLADISLPDTALRTFNGSLAFTDQALAAAGYSVWQNGQALVVPHEFRYRETILITLSPLLPDQQRTVSMIGPDNVQLFSPERELNNTALFIVGPDWPSGDYRLQVTLTSSTAEEQQVKSSHILSVVDRWERDFVEPPMSRRVEANFADQVKLLGYDLGANRAEPGGGIPLTLYWQGLDWLGDDYTIFTKLLSADQTVHGGRDRLPREGYRTIYWAPGEIVTDPFGVPVDADAPPGVYYLNIGLYKQVNHQAVSLPLVQDGQPIDASSITIGPVKIGTAPPGLTRTSASPQAVVNQPFGDAPNLTLIGYDLAEAAGDNCQLSIVNCQLSITLYWRSEARLAVDYTTFVHLRNAAGETVAQKDQPPLNGAYPTSLWDSGEIIADPINVSLPADLPPGEYQLVIGLYDLATGMRLAVQGSPDNSLLLRKVMISP